MCYGSLSHTSLIFTIEDVCIWLKTFGLSKSKISSTYKGQDARMDAKRSTCMDKLYVSLCITTNHALCIGQSLHKGGLVNNVNIYQTIIVNSHMTMVFGCIMELHGLKKKW